MYCPNCGSKNNDDFLYCENCGTRLSGLVAKAQPRGETASHRTLYIILGTAAVLLVILFAVIFSKKTTSAGKNANPSHYGVFVRQNRTLVELQAREIFSIPVESEMENAQTINTSQPIIVIWQDNTNLEYLILYKLGQYISKQKEIHYNATPGENGIIEISPTIALVNGVYCLVQGNPLAISLPAWCFQIGTIANNGSSPSSSTTIPIKGTPIPYSFQYCFKYEQAEDFNNASDCYKNWTSADPGNFDAWDNYSRTLGNLHQYQLGIVAAQTALKVAETPENKVKAYLDIGVFYNKLGDASSAITNLLAGYAVQPYDGTYKADILIWLSWSYRDDGQSKKACETYKQTLELAKKYNYKWVIDNANDGLKSCP
jgi:tetratricopeptide (TPR) repeat protein